jgi:amphi-Trp domain-containing protein
MKKNKNILVKSKSEKSTVEVAKFLHAIADRIEAGKIKFAQGEQETELEIPNHTRFSVKAREKDLKNKGLSRKVTFQLHWFEGKDELLPLEVK